MDGHLSPALCATPSPCIERGSSESEGLSFDKLRMIDGACSDDRCCVVRMKRCCVLR